MFGLKALRKTLQNAGIEIAALNVENRKYLAEIERLRTALKAAMIGSGRSAAEVREIVLNQRTQ